MGETCFVCRFFVNIFFLIVFVTRPWLSWRESIYQKYNPLLDSLRASEVLIKKIRLSRPVVYALIQFVKESGIYYCRSCQPSSRGPEVVQQKTGSCRELTDFVVYVCRALGIPCAIDFMPIRGDENDSHQWVAFTDKYGTLYYHEFPNGVSEVRKDAMCGMPKIKVYRNTFSLNRAMQEEMQKLDISMLFSFSKNPS